MLPLTLWRTALGSGGELIQALQELVGGELDLLVPPLGRPVHAGDDAHAVDAPEVPVDERVPGLGLVSGTVGKPEMPSGVLVPGMTLQEGVLIAGLGLDLAPVAVEHVLAAVDEPLGLPDRVRVHRIRSHDSIL